LSLGYQNIKRCAPNADGGGPEGKNPWLPKGGRKKKGTTETRKKKGSVSISSYGGPQEKKVKKKIRGQEVIDRLKLSVKGVGGLSRRQNLQLEKKGVNSW